MAVTLHAHTMSAVLSGNRGAVGVGIADITFNDDYTMTITLTDGSTYTSGNLRGAQGIPGIDAEYDDEELVITEGNDTISDGGEVSTIRVKGEARVIRDRVTEEMACSAYPTETVTGDIVTISDGAENIPVKTLSVAVEPKQAGSGDPSPTNIRPISGVDSVNVVRCGKNLYDASALRTYSSSGITATVNGGSISLSGTATANAFFSVYGITDKIGNYVLSLNNPESNSGVHVVFRTSDGGYFGDTQISTINKTTTISNNQTYGVLLYVISGTTVSNFVVTPQLEIGSTATTYEPYTGDSHSISFPSTVYGGTLDVASGVMTVDRGMVTLNGSENYWSNPTAGTGYYQFIAWGSYLGASSSNTAITSYFPLINLSERGVKSGLVSYPADDGYRFSLNTDMGISTIAEWKAYLAEHPLQLCYALATPQTITLDPTTITTLLGNNTLYADAGQVSVCYRADVGLYIDKRIAEVQALVLES